MTIISGCDFDLETFEVFRKWIEDLGKPETRAGKKWPVIRKVIGFELSAGVQGVVATACDVKIPVRSAMEAVDVAKKLFDSNSELNDFKVKYVYDDKERPIKETATVHMEGFLDTSRGEQKEQSEEKLKEEKGNAYDNERDLHLHAGTDYKEIADVVMDKAEFERMKRTGKAS